MSGLVISGSGRTPTRKKLAKYAQQINVIEKWPQQYMKETTDMNNNVSSQTRLKGILHTQGQDVMLVATGRVVERALHAAQMLHTRGMTASVIELRTGYQLDTDIIVKAVAETGCVVVAAEVGVVEKLVKSISELLSEELEIPMQSCSIDPDVFESSDNRIFDKALQVIAMKGHFTSTR